MFALRRAVSLRPAVRALHTTPSVAKKAKPEATLEVEEEAEMDLGDDLFGSVESSAGGSSSRAAYRAEVAATILDKKATRVGTLRKVIQLSDSAEDLEDLEKVLRSWRVAGMRVTNQTATELVGRCIKLGRPDLAKKYISDRLQYGVPPLAANMEAKLEKSLQA